jgi:allophanate hydrolase
MSSDSDISLDLPCVRARFADGSLAPTDLLDIIYARIERYPDRAVWIDLLPRKAAGEQLAAALRREEQGISQPLLGIPFAVKDNIDVAGRPTTGACPAFAYTAAKSATAVARLCEAGAILIGKTNLDQFAAGLVGVRSPYGACRNTFDERFISGGSSSGSAVAVAAGLVSFSLGTDTAGSGRVPAAFNNIVGLKPTRGLISAAGVVPACRSLDCVSIFALTCADAATVFEIAAAPDPEDPYSRTKRDFAVGLSFSTASFRFGIPRDEDLRFFGNADAARLYSIAIDRMRSIGGTAVTIDYTPFAKAAALLYGGPWVAERALVVKDLLASNPEAMLPVTRSIIEPGLKVTAMEAFEGLHALATLTQAAKAVWEQIDLLLLPTAGTIYTREQIEANPIKLNSNLGYYTNFVNLMDLCGVAVPGGFQSDGLPFGVTLIGPAGLDQALLTLGDTLHRAEPIRLGATSAKLGSWNLSIRNTMQTQIKLAVVGAHLSGQPLNHQLTDRSAKLVRACRTANCYRLYALPGTTPPKPGLIRVESGGGQIALEVWEISAEAFGTFVAAIPPPLGIGTIELEDGERVKGFLCESYALAGATDITHFGGWLNFLKGK